MGEFVRLTGINRSRLQRYMMADDHPNAEEAPFAVTLLLAYAQTAEGLAEMRRIAEAHFLKPGEF